MKSVFVFVLTASDNQKEEEMQNKNNSRERTTREERLEEYNARIESKTTCMYS